VSVTEYPQEIIRSLVSWLDGSNSVEGVR
jgi:hypothetical protein